MNYHGKGISKNYDEALKWYTLAAKQGYESSQFNLALMNYHGKGISKITMKRSNGIL